MALKNNEQFSELDGVYDPPIDARRILSVVFGPLAGGLTHDKGTIVAYDTVNNHYVAWDPAGINGVNVAKGVLWPEAVSPDAADECIALVMMAGTIRLEDLKAGAGVTATPTQIKDAVAATFRELGIIVLDHDEVR